jgi:hypothetical protein
LDAKASDSLTLTGKARERRKKRDFMREASSDGVRAKQIGAVGEQFT